MLRTPIPNYELSRLEGCGPDQLLAFFETSLKKHTIKADYGRLSDAWQTLFSGLYLSPAELVEDMQSGKHRLGDDKELMLREFIKADCAVGGLFTFNIIKRGGMIDRAALIMIADLSDLARIQQDGVPGLHVLVSSCDKRVRPALIRKAGSQLLSTVYDRNGMPILFLLFGLGDVSRFDVEAVSAVFSKDDLRKTMVQTRMGRNGLEVFNEISEVLKMKGYRDQPVPKAPGAIKTVTGEEAVPSPSEIRARPLNADTPPVKAHPGKKKKTAHGSTARGSAASRPPAVPVPETSPETTPVQASSVSPAEPAPVPSAPGSTARGPFPFKPPAAPAPETLPEETPASVSSAPGSTARGPFPFRPPAAPAPETLPEATPASVPPAEPAAIKFVSSAAEAPVAPPEATLPPVLFTTPAILAPVPSVPPARVISPGVLPDPGETGSLMKILIVDDDEIIRGLLKVRLQMLGYTLCTMAENGEEAVKLARATQPDFVFMDISMPGEIDGIAAAQEIRGHMKTRIIFLSAYSEKEILDRAREIRPDGYILKPFTDTDLRVILELRK